MDAGLPRKCGSPALSWPRDLSAPEEKILRFVQDDVFSDRNKA